MAHLQETHRFTSPLPPAALLPALAAQTEPTEWPPRLVMKLSGGGIVCRVMEAPETPLPFFGLVSDDRVRLAVSSRGRQVTPFQPILLLTITEDGDGDGSHVAVTLRPHREARSLAGLYAGLGVLIILAAIPAALLGDVAALLGMGVGLAALLFPRYRASVSFSTDRDQALALLTETLPLTAAPR